MIEKVEPPSIRPKLAKLRKLTVVAALLAATQSVAALDAVSMQLKWKHQFQFAGYYQALEQGFYRDAGLDVTIREGGPDIDVSEAVAGGKADFGVCSAGVLRDWASGRRLVVLAAIFQRYRGRHPGRTTGNRRKCKYGSKARAAMACLREVDPALSLPARVSHASWDDVASQFQPARGTLFKNFRRRWTNWQARLAGHLDLMGDNITQWSRRASRPVQIDPTSPGSERPSPSNRPSSSLTTFDPKSLVVD